jgi:hypothetical protein
MVMRGDSGRFEEALERFDAVLLWDAFESYEVLRERAGCELGGGLMDGFSDPESTGLSKDFSPKLKRVLVLLGAGLIIAGDILLRKSRYADGGVMGVLSSSFRRKPGEGAIGLSISEGKVPEPGVWREDAVLERLSKPAAYMVAVAVADAMVVCRRLRKRATEESNE